MTEAPGFDCTFIPLQPIPGSPSFCCNSRHAGAYALPSWMAGLTVEAEADSPALSLPPGQQPGPDEPTMGLRTDPHPDGLPAPLKPLHRQEPKLQSVLLFMIH